MPEIYGMPERYSRISPAARGACWHPACVRGVHAGAHETDMGENWQEAPAHDPRRAMTAPEIFAKLREEAADPAAREISSEAVDWPARLRAAAEAIDQIDPGTWSEHEIACALRDVAQRIEQGRVGPYAVQAIGRALLGEDT